MDFPTPTPPPRKPRYDFTPFPSHPTPTPPGNAKHEQKEIKPLSIPETKIPSPLAAHLAPHTLLDLREFLCGSGAGVGSAEGKGGEEGVGGGINAGAVGGNGVSAGAGVELGGRRGEGIWRAWRRGWEVWNGFFIEGRTPDATWVRERYEGVKREVEEEREKTRRRGDDVFERDVNVLSTPTLRTAKEVEDSDGKTGGFLPLKLWDVYREREGEWDGIANSVWMPMRVGEKHVAVRLDEQLKEKSEFEFDGGVDCGRMPYPCLRPLIQYVKKDNCWTKRKTWDGVTGTIFNLPTHPIEVNESDDEQCMHINTLYYDAQRDCAPYWRNVDYFPLDIRRIDRIDPECANKRAKTPLLAPGEEMVRFPWENPAEKRKVLREDDPWWVEPVQRELQDVPARKYPPPALPCGGGDSLLLTDDTLWKDEVENDEQLRSCYFVANLHGGTLIVNGVEVKKGRVAGPLPEFAVIETEGGQVSFWFGAGGRNWRCGSEGVGYESQWEALRKMVGWENVALTAGQVWDLRIREKVTRDFMGEENVDDGVWEEWKNAKRVEERGKVEKKSPLDVEIWDGVGTDPSKGRQIERPQFSTELEELQWLITKAQPLLEVTPFMQKQNLLEPPESRLWPGPYRSIRPDVIAQRQAQQLWDEHKETFMREHRQISAVLAQNKRIREQEKQRRIDLERRKRVAEGPLGPTAKRARFEAEKDERVRKDNMTQEALTKVNEDIGRVDERRKLPNSAVSKHVKEAAEATKARKNSASEQAAEQRRQRYIADQKAAAEKEENTKYVRLFVEKYGQAPSIALGLPASQHPQDSLL